ncbi:double-strand break repair helicase AddA [Coralliovum pocilloporae]|uniref:double-strand break repair helicase AddA n=1 Tax=Coralliovum pocilloporae TaxID=3066369 RepID=UPI0033078967
MTEALPALTIPAETIAAQRKACDPESSAWVSANAGSGKTFVLSRRVIRLLLSGSDPSRLLCLTFTKAAAAEMKTRVFDELADWTGLSDMELDKRLEDLVGRRPKAGERDEARQLFARALETPGGLKVQTIHAFCQALLQQFPFEANVAGHFSVVDDAEQSEMLAEALNSVLVEAAADPAAVLGRALVDAVAAASDDAARDAVSDMIGRRDVLRRWLETVGSVPEAMAELARSLDLPEGLSLPQVLTSGCHSPTLPNRFVDDLLILLRQGSSIDQSLADRFEAALNASDDEARLMAWVQVFFTGKPGDEKPRAWSRFCTKAVKATYPEFEDKVLQEQDRLLAVLDQYRLLKALEATEAIVRLSDAVIARYERMKNNRGLLDYDDLILKTMRLLSDTEAARWVQYKMDQGLDHILVDEAQDTSPNQWQVIRALADDFFDGDSARPVERTLFAVGDEKQSIYSFQGAAPEEFARMEKAFSGRARAVEKTWHSLKLNLSFRSTPDVLGAVDQVFRSPDAHRGLSLEPEPPVHEAVRRNDPGLVEIWPPTLTDHLEADTDWTVPVDHVGAQTGLSRLANRIADTIQRWLQDGERLEGTGERISAGDILVLVRKRGAFIDALNRALKDRSIPIAGADRLSLSDHIVVEDLLALGDVMLLPEDDLSLAVVLKSPLVGYSEDELYDLAAHRKGTLWGELGRRARTEKGSCHERAFRQLNLWRERTDFDRPFEFYARVLGEGGGRKSILGQLGAEAEDVLDEFLNLALSFESKGIPSLQGFLTLMRKSGTDIKRELDQGRDEIRVMTVHGAKGLEAPVVFLVDSGSAPVSAAHDPSLLQPKEDYPRLLWAPRKAIRPSAFADRLQMLRGKQEEEYRRLLYVAMTRARDRLLVTAYGNQKEPHDQSWYALIKAGLSASSNLLQRPEGESLLWRDSVQPSREHKPDAAEQAARAAPSLPAWLAHAARPESKPPRPLAASALDDADFTDGVAALAQASGLSGAERGTLLHKLLEFLPDVVEDERRVRAFAYLSGHPGISRAEAEQLADHVCVMLSSPQLTPFFSADARSEVPIVGVLEREGKPVRIAGRIDRLVKQGAELFILDYKTNRKPPVTAENVPLSYLAQMSAYVQLLGAAYPDLSVRGFLYWTETARLMELPEGQMNAAWADWSTDASTRLDGPEAATYLSADNAPDSGA